MKKNILDIIPSEEFVQDVFVELASKDWIYIMKVTGNVIPVPSEVIFDDKFYEKYDNLKGNKMNIAEKLIKETLLNYTYCMTDLSELNLEACKKAISVRYKRYIDNFRQCSFK